LPNPRVGAWTCCMCADCKAKRTALPHPHWNLGKTTKWKRRPKAEPFACQCRHASDSHVGTGCLLCPCETPR